jgi:ABC-type sugar transport system permease subunit
MEKKGKVEAFFRKDSTQAVCMLAPILIGFFVFTYYPILYILKYAFYRFDGFAEEFIGIENFIRVFSRDSAFWESLWNTLVLAAGKLAFEIPLALILALLLYKALKGTGIFRVLLFMPTIISPAIIGLIFSLMFAGYQGVINGMLQDAGMITQPIDWFSQKWTAMFVLGLASVWANIGINIIFFLMALQSIPKELHECAKLDGAGGVKKFCYVTLPMIGPIFRVVLLNAIIGSLKVSDLVLSSTNGQPDGKTEVAMTYVFKYFFGYGGRKIEVGYASCMAVVTALFLGIITIIYLKSSKKMEAE